MQMFSPLSFRAEYDATEGSGRRREESVKKIYSLFLLFQQARGYLSYSIDSSLHFISFAMTSLIPTWSPPNYIITNNISLHTTGARPLHNSQFTLHNSSIGAYKGR